MKLAANTSRVSGHLLKKFHGQRSKVKVIDIVALRITCYMYKTV